MLQPSIPAASGTMNSNLNDDAVHELLASHEQQIKNSIPSVFSKPVAALDSPSALFSDYQKTGNPVFKDAAGSALDKLSQFAKNSIDNIFNPPTYTRAETDSGIDPNHLSHIKNALFQMETGSSTIKDPYKFYQPSGSRIDGLALGKYQTTQGELETYGKKYLGFVPTAEQFLNQPQLQEAYMAQHVADLLKKGYTAAQIADIHRSGSTASAPGDSEPMFNHPDYVKKFKSFLQE